MTSCDDDDPNDPPRLFRPVTTLSNSGNNIIAKWDNMKGALSYNLTLMKATGEKDENNEDIYAQYREVSTENTSYTFEDVEWDEKYKLYIQAFGNNIESGVYETDDLSVVYITKMGTNPNTIDNAVLVEWKIDGNPITLLRIFPVDGGDTIDVVVSEAEYNLGKKAVWGLDSETSYRLIGYSGEEQTGDTYEGRISFKTAKPENYDEMFGSGKWLDLRGVEDTDILKSDTIKGFEAIILQGGFEYKVNNSIVFSHSQTFVTGLTLEGNAVFIQSGGFQATGNVDKVKFEKVDFISDKAYETPVRDYTAKSFDGRQVYNVNNTNSTINEMIFKNCRIEGYRAVVRLQGDTDGIRSLTFENCTLNGVGDQGVVTTNNKSAAIDNIVFSNSTLLNIVMLCDLRASAGSLSLNINDCTFCYAPIETKANANTPLLRFGSNPVNVSINNSIFGPSLATDNSGGELLKTYTAGTAGSIFLNGSAASVGVTNSYRTNFSWTEIGEAKATYPIESLEDIRVDEKTLFQEAEQENFMIMYSFGGSKTSGATKWRMP